MSAADGHLGVAPDVTAFGAAKHRGLHPAAADFHFSGVDGGHKVEEADGGVRQSFRMDLGIKSRIVGVVRDTFAAAIHIAEVVVVLGIHLIWCIASLVPHLRSVGADGAAADGDLGQAFYDVDIVYRTSFTVNLPGVLAHVGLFAAAEHDAVNASAFDGA